MRLPASRVATLGLVSLLAACGGDKTDGIALGAPPLQHGSSDRGPAGDYPMVLGKPFTVDGITYTPEDRLNYDQVGYAGIGEGEGISIAHRTLPLPSYAEVTSLDSGRTILVRVTRRGPMSGARLIELSPAAAAQLGVTGTAPIRVRRVNPPEQERAMLRMGGQAPARMDTPKSLVAVLMRKLGGGAATPTQAMPPLAADARVAAAPTPAPPPAKAEPKATAPVAAKPKVQPEAAPKGAIIVQAGAYSSEQTARHVAEATGGRVSAAGKLFRVRMGPFSSPAAAQAALAKVRAAGYSDARIQRAD